MSTPTPLRSVIIIGVVVIVGAGAYWVGRQQGKISVMLEKMEGAGPAAPEMGRLQEENARLTMENARLQEQRTAQEVKIATVPNEAPANAPATTGVIERLRILAELQQQKLGSFSAPVVSPDGKLQPGFAQLFNLTPAEKDTLQQAFDYARQQTEQMSTANATVSRREDGSVVISIPPSPGGSALRDTVLGTIAQTLGPERHEAFLALYQSGSGQVQFANAMNGFGADERTVTVSRIAGPNGTSRVSVQSVNRSPGGSPAGTSSFSFGTSATDVSQLPGNLRWIGPLVPADF